MSHEGSADDLAPTATSGYKVAPKKTAAELAQLDAQDGTLLFQLLFRHTPCP